VRLYLDVTPSTVSRQHNDSVALQADEVANLEAEKERILQRLPGSAKPAANGTEEKAADGQTANGTEGERMLPRGSYSMLVLSVSTSVRMTQTSRSLEQSHSCDVPQRRRAMLPLNTMQWKAATMTSTAEQRRKRPASAGNPAHGPMTCKLQGTPLPRCTSPSAGAGLWQPHRC